MSRKKNALRKHFIAPYTEDEVEPKEWLRLAKNISTIEDDSEEKTESAGDYAGDGNEVEVLTGRSEKWKFDGTYDPTDPAQKFVADKKRTNTDSERLVWHKIEENDGSTVTGVAKLLEIKAGGGDATEYETFSGVLAFIKTPTVSNGSAAPEVGA